MTVSFVRYFCLGLEGYVEDGDDLAVIGPHRRDKADHAPLGHYGVAGLDARIAALAQDHADLGDAVGYRRHLAELEIEVGIFLDKAGQLAQLCIFVYGAEIALFHLPVFLDLLAELFILLLEGRIPVKISEYAVDAVEHGGDALLHRDDDRPQSLRHRGRLSGIARIEHEGQAESGQRRRENCQL